MITRTYRTRLHLEHTVFCNYDKTELLFFDIETTGLTARSSSLYLIGAVSFQGSDWQVTQWFAETPDEEASVLETFMTHASHYKHLIHFNGDRFDIPYLADKCYPYRICNTLPALQSHDLYRMIRPLKSMLQLSSLKQKSLEEFLGIYREDRFTGGELISVYQEYMFHPTHESEQILLLHNYEDLLGMLALLPILSYLAILDGNARVCDCTMDGDCMMLMAELPTILPQPFSFRTPLYLLSGRQEHIVLRVEGVRGTLKHFFTDYKNYYYLPLEDTAIHKSVATYVDKEYREQAKASTCYHKMEGFFFPQKQEIVAPIFKEKHTDRLLYFQCTDAFLESRELQQKYLEHLLRIGF